MLVDFTSVALVPNQTQTLNFLCKLLASNTFVFFFFLSLLLFLSSPSFSSNSLFYIDSTGNKPDEISIWIQECEEFTADFVAGFLSRCSAGPLEYVTLMERIVKGEMTPKPEDDEEEESDEEGEGNNNEASNESEELMAREKDDSIEFSPLVMAVLSIQVN